MNSDGMIILPAIVCDERNAEAALCSDQELD